MELSGTQQSCVEYSRLMPTQVTCSYSPGSQLMGHIAASCGAGVGSLAGRSQCRKVLVIPHFLTFTFEKLVFKSFYYEIF